VFPDDKTDELPNVRRWAFEPWPTVPASGVEMEFRLVYSGRLPAASQSDTRVREKHAIRRVFSKQLAELWRTNPRLMRAVTLSSSDLGSHYRMGGVLDVGPQRVDIFDRCGRRFLPLVNNSTGVGCALDILFLRRDQPGSLISSGGDIDNRLKVLFDSLRLPSNEREVFGDPAEEDNPFYCLLEDDRLITEVKVTTDRLLLPPDGDEHLNDVRLVIHVKTVVIDTTKLLALSF
jgi:hypothetical protein